jgi:site-specific DNA-methyltransferase (adenine-specific)
MRKKLASAHAWVVQTADQKPIPFPDKDGIVVYERLGPLKNQHPCIKSVEEMVWIVEALTSPGDVVLDPFCGLGATLIACQRTGRHYIGCDISEGSRSRAELVRAANGRKM